MSFSFTACGSRDEAIGQLRSLVISDQLGAAVAAGLAAALEATPDAELVTGHRWAYFAEASGHGEGGTPPYLNASLRSVYVPGVTLAPAAQDSG